MKNFLLIMIIILVLFAGIPNISAEQPKSKSPAYLVVMTLPSTGQSYFNFNYHKVSDLETCYDLIEHSRIEIPTGGDAEAVVTMYCVPSKAKIWTYKEMKGMEKD
jgi:hypothetical protein